MRYGSVCSGVEAATAAWHQLGWTPQWFSEIEKFPSAVLEHHYPDVPNFGDMTKFKEWKDDPIDLLVGGTPCQSFSIAGLRKGLDDPRGNLMLTYVAIATRYKPRWLVWENVPGVLSSNRGRDFGALLTALGEIGYGFAYRVLDAQYFGVAQRRRRVFVVGYLGDWRRAAAVLFERESLSGHPAPSRETRKETSRWPAQCASTLNAAFGSKLGLEDQHINGGAPLFVPHTVGSLCARTGRAMSAQDAQQGHMVPIAFDAYNNDITGDVTKTIDTGQDYHHVPIAFGAQNSANQGDSVSEYVTPTLDKSKTPAAMTAGSVRRLTPTECERLQGFPDGYTQIAWRNKAPEDCPDGPRYKAMGNSMAVPVMRWIGQRINEVDKIK